MERDKVPVIAGSDSWGGGRGGVWGISQVSEARTWPTGEYTMSPTVHSLEGLCFQSMSARASPALPADTGSPATPFRCLWTAEISRLASVCNRNAVQLRAPASHQMRGMNSLSSPTRPIPAGPLPHRLQLHPGSELSGFAPPSSPPLPWASGVGKPRAEAPEGAVRSPRGRWRRLPASRSPRTARTRP